MNVFNKELLIYLIPTSPPPFILKIKVFFLLKKDVSIAYVSGNMTGILCDDSFSIAGLTVKNQSFMLVK